MISFYGVDEGFNVDSIKTLEELYEVLDYMHSMAMEECGAHLDYSNTSDSLKVMTGILDFVGHECEDAKDKLC